MVNTDDDRYGLVVGVDFGTTYSGIAYTHTSEPDFTDIQVIKSWPGNVGNFEKAPTEISYTRDSSSWGYEIQPGTERSGYFKLLLDAKATATQYDNAGLISNKDSYTKIPLPAGKSASAVTTDYLRHLYDHLINTLRQKLTKTIDNTPIQFVLTTPAIWSHEAQNATREAAVEAGFTSREGDTLSMVSEPEAAASYCLKEMFSRRKETKDPLKIGERIVVCDAGGGTVDLITYAVERVTPSLRLCEAAVSSGGKCGSVALDKAFLKLLEARLGRTFRRWPSKKTSRGSSLMMAFDIAKKEFGSTTHDDGWQIPLGYIEDDLSKGIEDGELNLTTRDMTKIFDPVVKQVIDLIAQQVQSSNDINGRNKVSVCTHIQKAIEQVKDSQGQTILLVGGFGESKYLFRKVEEWAEGQSYPIRVVNPDFSWSAVVRGAVLYGVDGIVHTRKLKQHYGVGIKARFIHGIHDEADAFIDPFSGRKLFSSNVDWLAAKGDDASVETVISITAGKSFLDSGRKLVTLSLMGCKFDEPPKDSKHWMVDRLCKVTCDLTDMPVSAFRTKNSATFQVGSTTVQKPMLVTKASFSVNMRVGSADIDLELVYQGESYGKASIDY